MYSAATGATAAVEMVAEAAAAPLNRVLRLVAGCTTFSAVFLGLPGPLLALFCLLAGLPRFLGMMATSTSEGKK